MRQFRLFICFAAFIASAPAYAARCGGDFNTACYGNMETGQYLTCLFSPSCFFRNQLWVGRRVCRRPPERCGICTHHVAVGRTSSIPFEAAHAVRRWVSRSDDSEPRSHGEETSILIILAKGISPSRRKTHLQLSAACRAPRAGRDRTSPRQARYA